MRSLILPLALALLLSACGESPTVSPDGAVADSGTLPVADADAVLELHALDIWGQALPAAEATLTVTRDGEAVATAGWPTASIALSEPGTWEVTLEADEHEPLTLSVVYAGGDALDAVVVRTDASAVGAGISTSHDVRPVSGRELPVHAVFLGLRHRWFSAQGRPARRGNRIELMTNGEDAWRDVAEEIVTASDRVHWASWWWESQFELVRDPATHVTSGESDRERNTVMTLLEESAAQKRVLIGQFVSQDGRVSTVNVDDRILDHGADGADRFEFMGQANETRGRFSFQVAPFFYRDVLALRRPALVLERMFDDELPIESTVPPREVDLTEWPFSLDVPVASYHQKLTTVDGRVAYVGGMNTKGTDWDTAALAVFEPRRMAFDAPNDERMEVEARERMPDFGPRKDYMTRLEGPIVADVDDLFRARWSHLLDTGARYSENASDFEVGGVAAPLPDGVQAQLTATLPQPFWEHSIAETWFNAVGNAERYIFIEDQYFRIPMLVDAIVERMTAVPDLQLVVVTKPVSESTDPGCEWTHRTHMELSALFPTRYFVYQLRAFDTVVTFGFDETEERFTDIDIHSKLLIVDDVFLSIGSCNKNNRGIVYEGELNVAVLDRDWVTEQRRRVLALMLPDGASVREDWITQLAEAASWNQLVWDNWDAEGGDISLDGAPLPMDYTPAGRVYPLDFRHPDECLIEGVGPDMT